MNACDFYAHCAGIPQLTVTRPGSSTKPWLNVTDPADHNWMVVKISVPCDEARLERAVAAFNAVMQDASFKDAAE